MIFEILPIWLWYLILALAITLGLEAANTHPQDWRDWLISGLMGLFWPITLCFAIGLGIYDWWKSRQRKRSK